MSSPAPPRLPSVDRALATDAMRALAGRYGQSALADALRAGLTIADATPGALALNGTGGAVAPGSGGGSQVKASGREMAPTSTR